MNVSVAEGLGDAANAGTVLTGNQHPEHER